MGAENGLRSHKFSLVCFSFIHSFVHSTRCLLTCPSVHLQAENVVSFPERTYIFPNFSQQHSISDPDFASEVPNVELEMLRVEQSNNSDSKELQTQGGPTVVWAVHCSRPGGTVAESVIWMVWEWEEPHTDGSAAG